MACSDVGTKILQEMLEGTFWEGVWPCLDPWDSVRLPIGTSLVKYGPHGELFSFFIKMMLVVAQTTSPTPLSLRKRSRRVRCR